MVTDASATTCGSSTRRTTAPAEFGHPPSPGAAGAARPTPHRAAALAAAVHAGAPVLYYGDEIAWAITFTWATAMACARRCSGRTIAMAASRVPIRQPGAAAHHGCALRYEAINVERSRAIRIRCSTGCGACSRFAGSSAPLAAARSGCSTLEPARDGVRARVHRGGPPRDHSVRGNVRVSPRRWN